MNVERVDVHTPGPWTQREHPIMSEKGVAIYSPGADYYIGEIWNVSGEPQNAANARLIAAAPDLLQALQWMLDAYDDAASSCDRENIAARAAIARATGGAE